MAYPKAYAASTIAKYGDNAPRTENTVLSCMDNQCMHETTVQVTYNSILGQLACQSAPRNKLIKQLTGLLP